MSDSDAIDLESVADTQQDSGDRSVSTGKKASSLYSLWRCEPAEFRDATHRGAHCLLCKAHQEERGQPVDPKGHCLADQPSILAHINDDIAPDLDPEDPEEIPVANKCKLADLFVDMPAFDLNLLFEDDLSVVPDVEDQT